MLKNYEFDFLYMCGKTKNFLGMYLKNHIYHSPCAQSCLTLCNPMDYTVHGILQARILEWVAFPFSRGSNPGLPHCRQILYQLSHKGSLCDQTGDYVSNAVPSMLLVEINPTSLSLSFICSSHSFSTN